VLESFGNQEANMPFKILLFLSITLLAACAPYNQPMHTPTATEVLPTQTASPTPEPTNTPEPTKELRPGIDTFEEVAPGVYWIFTKVIVTDNYYNPEVFDYHYNIKLGIGQTWLVVEGSYKGNILSAYGQGKVHSRDE